RITDTPTGRRPNRRAAPQSGTYRSTRRLRIRPPVSSTRYMPSYDAAPVMRITVEPLDQLPRYPSTLEPSWCESSARFSHFPFDSLRGPATCRILSTQKRETMTVDTLSLELNKLDGCVSLITGGATG